MKDERAYLNDSLDSKTAHAHKPGEILLSGGDELFFNQDVIKFYEYVLNHWKSQKPLALYLGCTFCKPFSKSFMHKKVRRLLEFHNLMEITQQYIISEPLTICPRELEEKYPAANYDFPPEKLREKGRKVFVYRLRTFFRKSARYHDYHIGFLPNHHRGILKETAQDLFEINFVPYNVYRLPELLDELRIIKAKLAEENV